MSKATEQWEALLQGTTTGPWMAVDEGHCYEILGRNPEKPGRFPIICDVDKLADSALMAAAPAAVAEIVRLRRELEERVAQYTANMHYQTKYEEGLANAYRYAALDLIDILEGNNE